MACLSCHERLTGPPHTANADCAACHMPKRRTEDVIHAVMTDHKIVRRPPPGNLLAPRREIPGNDYSGEVVLYYPPADKDQDLYLAIAQVIQKSNLEGGVPRLEAVIRSQQPRQGRLYFTLGQAYERQGKKALAEDQYRQAIRQDAAFVPALWKLADLLRREGRVGEALPLLEKARAISPTEAGVHYTLGLVYRDLGRAAEAVTEMEAAIANDSDFPDPHNSLGGILMELGDRDRARGAFLEALRQQPDLAEAQGNFGHSLAAAGDYPRAEYHLLEAIRLKPDSYSAWQTLGDVQSARGAWALAKRSYLEVLRAHPQDEAASLGLGTAQAATGELAAARVTLRRAAEGKNPAIRQEALELLKQLR
jgi:tetratricopeptide (TPR) repeat protein